MTITIMWFVLEEVLSAFLVCFCLLKPKVGVGAQSQSTNSEGGSGRSNLERRKIHNSVISIA